MIQQSQPSEIWEHYTFHCRINGIKFLTNSGNLNRQTSQTMRPSIQIIQMNRQPSPLTGTLDTTISPMATLLTTYMNAKRRHPLVLSIFLENRNLNFPLFSSLQNQL